MNKTVIIIITAVAVVAVIALAFGVVTFIRAERMDNFRTAGAWDARGFDGYPGMMGGNANFSPRLMGDQTGYGPSMMGGKSAMDPARGYAGIQEYMNEALAEKLGMSADDITAAFEDGKTMLDLAADKDMTVKEFITMQEEVHILAIDKALDAGVISQNQADWMKENPGGPMMGGFRR